MTTLLLVGNTILTIIIIITIVNNKKTKCTSPILFESKKFSLYKIMTYMGYLSTVLLIVLFIILAFDTNPTLKSIALQGVTWLLIFFSQWITYPQNMMITQQGIYYPMRLKGLKLASSFKNIGAYTFSEKNKLIVISKFDKKIRVEIMGALSNEESILVKEVMTTQDIPEL